MDISVWCDIICGHCAAMCEGSGYDIDKRKLKNKAKKLGWKWTDEYGNTCPECLKEIEKTEEHNNGKE